MADPQTIFLKLTKPIVNDEEGEDLWGDKLNNNFDLIDAFASQQGALVEAPQDDKVYGRGTPEAWIETIGKTQYDSDIVTLDNRIDGVEAAIPNKEDLISFGQSTEYWAGNKTWQALTWTVVAGKPTTFPPTLPIASSDVTGLDAKQASQDSAIAANVTALGGKEPIIAAGNPAYFWAGDKTWKPVPAAGIPEAPSDGRQYLRKGSDTSWQPYTAAPAVGLVDIADTPPASPIDKQLWWESDSGSLFVRYNDGTSTQWVQTNVKGLTDAPNDGKTYARKNGAWVVIA